MLITKGRFLIMLITKGRFLICKKDHAVGCIYIKSKYSAIIKSIRPYTVDYLITYDDFKSEIEIELDNSKLITVDRHYLSRHWEVDICKHLRASGINEQTILIVQSMPHEYRYRVIDEYMNYEKSNDLNELIEKINYIIKNYNMIEACS